MFRHSIPQKLFLLLLALFLLLPALLASAAPGRQECTPPYCYEPPPEEPPAPPPDNPPPSGGSWSGYSDGRLNPDMAEYYTIYCVHDRIEVWGGKPAPQLIVAIYLGDIAALDDGEPYVINNGMVVTRSGDTVIVTGSNGNNAPNPGSKSFSLSECIAHNGSLPPLPPTATPTRTPQIVPTATPTPDPAEQAVEDVNLCLPGSLSMADFLRCLNFFSPDNPSATYIYVINWAIVTFCSGGFTPLIVVSALPAIRIWRRRRKQ